MITIVNVRTDIENIYPTDIYEYFISNNVINVRKLSTMKIVFQGSINNYSVFIDEAISKQ